MCDIQLCPCITFPSPRLESMDLVMASLIKVALPDECWHSINALCVSAFLWGGGCCCEHEQYEIRVLKSTRHIRTMGMNSGSLLSHPSI